MAEELLAEAVWPGHPLGRPLAGTLEASNRCEEAISLIFGAAVIRRGRRCWRVAGRVRREEVLAALAPLVKSMSPGAGPRFRRWRHRPGETPRVRVERRDDEQAQLMLGFTAPDRQDDGRFAARVLSAILGEKMNSRLFQNLRERRGLCYSIQSETSTYADTGLLSISVGLDARKLPRRCA